MLFQFFLQYIYKHWYYIIALVFFVFWFLFSDMHSYVSHIKLSNDIEKIQKEIDFLNSEIQKDLESLQEINSLKGKEKFGREKYYLKRENEDIYIIEFDTI